MDARTILRWVLPKPLREALRSLRSRLRMRRIGVRGLERMPGRFLRGTYSNVMDVGPINPVTRVWILVPSRSAL